MSKLQFESSCEDTVKCCFFSSVLVDNSDEKLWNQLCENINNTITTLSKEYIWHRDEFKVYLPIFEKNYIIPHLVSITNFGDNLEDEWFIVYLIFELTKLYEDLTVQINDNDGDFLLIEAADYLPSWVKPENSENRVFIHKNHLHIIPPSLVGMEREFDLKEVIDLVTNPDVPTQVSSEIEQAILSRIGNYPEKIKENFHTAIVKLPIQIAGLLNLYPALISPLVCTYCNHDVLDAKACKDLAYENCGVFVEVKFTKYLYAMLMHAKPIKNINHAVRTEKDKRISIGYKLACGLHMIMKSSSDIYASKEFNQFLKTLKGNGFFKSNIEGSKQYQELMKKAKEFFAAIECPVNLHVFNIISKLMNSNEYEQEIDLIKTKNIVLEDLHEDNEDWLNVQPEQLNELLYTRYGKKSVFKNQDEITPQSITAELTDFIKKTSDFEGIETREVENENENIQFDADEFTDCLEKFLNIISNKDDNSNLDSDLSDDEEDISLSEEKDEELDRELKLKLNYDVKCHNKNIISFNIVQSMKEEQASSGPSSNLLKAVGLNKIDFLDSDDNED